MKVVKSPSEVGRGLMTLRRGGEGGELLDANLDIEILTPGGLGLCAVCWPAAAFSHCP